MSKESPLHNLFCQISIAKRLFIGFAILIGCTLIVAYTAWKAEDNISHSADVTIRFSDIASDVRSVHTDEKNYLLSGKSDYLDHAIEQINQIESDKNELQEIVTDPAVADALSAILDDIKQYKKDIIKLRSGQGDVTRLDKEMKELTDHIFEQVETVKTKKKTEMEKTKASSQALIMMSSGGATVLGMGIAFIISAGISGPVNRMTDVMGVLADDNTDIDIPYQDRGDELGDMAQAVNIFKKSAIKRKEIEAEQERLDAKRAEEKRRMMNELADEFENTVGGIVTAVSSSAEELEATATDLSATADQTKQQATSVAGGAEESASNVQTVASAAEELSASIAEVSTQVMKSAEKSKQAEQRAADATEQVSGLNNAANQIGQVIELIQDIAEQTNLLALNATIEAARAGDAGKGFAVVASEVKSLANDTAKATARITEYIDQIQSETKTAVHAIDGISSTIDEINDMAQSVSAAAEQQDAATKEIARNVQEASQGTREVTKNITGLTQAAQDTGAASDQMLSSAKTLATNSSKLEAEVNDFLVKIREG